MSAFEQFSGIRETVPAWVECKECKGEGKILVKRGPLDMIMDYCKVDCPSCQGARGAWHPDVKTSEWFDGTYMEINGLEIIKDTFLVREWALCSRCSGKKRARCNCAVCQGLIPQEDKPTGDDAFIPCPHCHKDEQGNPTGCEPGTQGRWEVKPCTT